MKKLLALFLFQLLTHLNVYSQCPTWTIQLKSQSDIDNFATNYPNCTEPRGLNIGEFEGTPITNLNGLNMITTVEGYLGIGGPGTHLVNLNGLGSVTSISGYLIFTNNQELINLSGLESLTEIGLDLIFRENSKLENLLALQNLTSVGKDFEIIENHALVDVDGLEALKSIGGNFNIEYNHNLTNLDGLNNLENTVLSGFYLVESNNLLTRLNTFKNLKQIDSYMSIESISLLSLEGLNSLETVGEFVELYNLHSITNLNALSSLTKVESIQINDSYMETLSGLDNLVYAKEELAFVGNPKLTTLSHLSNVTVADYIDISYNPMLTNLEGLNNIVSGVIGIDGNVELSDISAIANMSIPLEFITIADNPKLAVCNVFSICEYLNDRGEGAYNISNNAVGCNNSGEILDNCDGILGVNDVEIKQNLSIVPNPTKGLLSIDVKNGIELLKVEVYSIIGKKLLEQEVETNRIDLRHLNSGMYILKGYSDKHIISKKIIKY